MSATDVQRAAEDMDRMILQLLTRDARMSAAEIGRRVGCSRTTAQTRIHRIEQAEQLQYTLRRAETAAPPALERAVLLVFRLDKSLADVFKHELRRIEQIEACDVMSGDLDMCIRLAADTRETLARAVDLVLALPGPGMVRHGVIERSLRIP